MLFVDVVHLFAVICWLVVFCLLPEYLLLYFITAHSRFSLMPTIQLAPLVFFASDSLLFFARLLLLVPLIIFLTAGLP